MVFSSPFFVFAFLPLALLLYFAAPARARNAVLLGLSLLFYTWGEKAGVLLIVASIGLNYLLGRWVARGGRLVLAVGVALNVATLLVFKYANFAAANFNALLLAIDLPTIAIKTVHLPIGVSFFTFEAIAYLVDVHRGNTSAQRNVADFGLFMTFFPHLIAGPVVRYRDLAAAIAARTVTRDGFASGVRRFIIGLAKKALLANTLGGTADVLFGLPPDQLGVGAAWLGVACYTLHIYFDFSGYSDMAIGLARLFGFQLCENFRYPYTAASVTDFWRRWHISLSSWFRDYLYIPLGGNRRGPLRNGLNLLTVFALCGLWHGASWAFLVWGLFHGAFLILERAGFGRVLVRLPAPVRHGYTLLAVMVGWVFFKADSLPHAVGYLRALCGLQTGPHAAGDYMNPELLLALAVGMVGCLPVLPALMQAWSAAKARFGTVGEWTGELAAVAAQAGLLLAATAQLTAGTYNPFIYYRF
jgi:alginate O-acetyltransferase complex protein AlgI